MVGRTVNSITLTEAVVSFPQNSPHKLPFRLVSSKRRKTKNDFENIQENDNLSTRYSEMECIFLFVSLKWLLGERFS